MWLRSSTTRAGIAVRGQTSLERVDKLLDSVALALGGVGLLLRNLVEFLDFGTRFLDLAGLSVELRQAVMRLIGKRSEFNRLLERGDSLRKFFPFGK